MALPNSCRRIPKEERVASTAIANNNDPQRPFAVYNDEFLRIIGSNPTVSVVLERDYDFAHEAPVYDPKEDAVYFCSNLLGLPDSNEQTITIHKAVRSPTGKWDCHDIQPDVTMCNGGINYGDDILFCSQGTMSEPGGIVKMSRAPPYKTSTLVDGFLGRQFNSVNDLVVHHDGSIWFTDPMYGWEQGFRPKPRLPCQVYRFDADSGDIRVVADGFGRPNGLCFSPDQKIMYITDTDIIHGVGSFDETRPGTIYAFDVYLHSGSPFLSNRRVFAMAARGAPDGIKCDTQGNVYSGCGDGVNVWGPSGTLLGKIELPGGVANFCFTRKGEMILLNEKMVWLAKIDDEIKGALLVAEESRMAKAGK